MVQLKTTLFSVMILMLSMASADLSLSDEKAVKADARVIGLKVASIDKAAFPRYFSASFQNGTEILLEVTAPFQIGGVEEQGTKILAVKDDKGDDLLKRSLQVKSEYDWKKINIFDYDNLHVEEGGNRFIIPLSLGKAPLEGSQSLNLMARLAVRRFDNQSKSKDIKTDDIQLESGTKFSAGGHDFAITLTSWGGVSGQQTSKIQLKSPVEIVHAVFKTKNGMYGSSVKPSSGQFMISFAAPRQLIDETGKLLLSVREPKVEHLDIEVPIRLGVERRVLAH